MENILFEYPVREENGSLDEEFQVLKKQLTKLKYAVMISSFCALTMYFLSAFFAKAELIFYSHMLKYRRSKAGRYRQKTTFVRL